MFQLKSMHIFIFLGTFMTSPLYNRDNGDESAERAITALRNNQK